MNFSAGLAANKLVVSQFMLYSLAFSLDFFQGDKPIVMKFLLVMLIFCQVIGIPMETNCAPLLADLFLYSYENEFLDNMIRSGHRRLASSLNLCYRYIDDLTVFNNKKFLDYLKEIYPSQLTVEKANKSYHLADLILHSS